MSDIAIKVENLSKSYKLYNQPVDRLKEALNPFRKKYHHDFYALKDINFEVKKGETFGIIGKNGAGKSTLLKILTGVLTQSSGKYFMNGRVSSLLELGAGFNPELSGLENVYFNGAVLGYSKEEMDRKIDDIIEFADIGEFINQPVKTYSSGMIVRLGFAVATSVDPDILIVDEALAVGDIRFQQKCFRKFRDFQDKGKTIIFVSHDVGAVINYCKSVIWLEDGEIIEIGDPEDVCRKYIAHMAFDIKTIDGKKETARDSNQIFNEGNIEFEDVSNCSFFGEGGAKIEGVALYSERSHKKINAFGGGEEVCFCFKIKVNRDILHPLVGFIVKDSYGNNILGLNSHILDYKLNPLNAGETIIAEFKFNFPFLKNGCYSISPAIAEGTQENHIQHHWVHDAYIVEIVNPDEAAKMGWYFLLKDANIKILK